MLIRKVTLPDAKAISGLSRQLGYNISEQETAKQITAISNSTSDCAYIVIDGDKIVGWIHAFYNIRMESASFCEIGGLVVDEQYRGKGIGKMLIEHIKPWCVQKKCATLRVRSNVKRTEAHKFYEHLCFHETKQQKIFELVL